MTGFISAPREGNPPCSHCGGPHPFDTVVPSALWNQVIRGGQLPDYLCLTCIVQAFTNAGLSLPCELWGAGFDGVSLFVLIPPG